MCIRAGHVSTKKPLVAIVAAISMQAEQREKGPFDEAFSARVSDPPAAATWT